MRRDAAADFFPQPMYRLSCRCHSCTSDHRRRRRETAQQEQPPAEKKSTMCKLLLPPASFRLDKMTATGLTSRCRKCIRRAGLEVQASTRAVPDPPAALSPTKYCPGCQAVQPRAAFYGNRVDWTGLQGLCIACKKQQALARRGAQLPGLPALLLRRPLCCRSASQICFVMRWHNPDLLLCNQPHLPPGCSISSIGRLHPGHAAQLA